MALLRDGTVLRKFPSLIYRDQVNGIFEDDSVTCEAAPVEDVTQVFEGLNTTITFTFKAVEGEETQPHCPTNSGYTILCAEGSVVNQKYFARIFAKFGQDYVMTANGQQVLDVYKSNPGRYPCILMDIMMPIMGGCEAASLIRAFEASQPSHRRALIIGLVIRPTVPTAQLLAAGFDLLMRKPLRAYELYELFLGGPQTNIVALYAGLTEKEKSAYPRRLVEHAALEDDPRYNAIRNELKRRTVPLWLTEGREGLVIDFCKVIVKVVKADDDEPSPAT